MPRQLEMNAPSGIYALPDTPVTETLKISPICLDGIFGESAFERGK
jgi:hypothetical protein